MTLYNQSMQWESSKRPELLLMMIGVMIWLQTIHSGFVHYDTPLLVVQNPILSDPTWSNVYKICCDLSLGTRTELGAEFLPIRDLSVAFDFFLFGENWVGHHLSNLVYYLAATWVFFQILTHFLGRNWAAWMGALLFLLHPTHVESVAWLASRKDVLSLLFFCLSIHALINFKRSILWATVWALAAYWSKNTAIALPPLLVWIHLIESRKANMTWREIIGWKKVFQWAPMTIFFSIGLGITLYIGKMVSMFAPQRGDGFLETASITLQAFGTYLELLIFPNNLSVAYPEPQASGLASLDLWLGIVLIGAALWAFTKWRKSSSLSIGGLIILLGLLPVSQIATIQNLLAERYLIIPSLGLCMMIATLLNVQRHGQIKWTLAVLMAIGFGVQSHLRIPDWRDSTSLWSAQIKSQPKVVRGWVALAGQHLENNDFEKAEKTYALSHEHLGDHPEVLQGEGLMYIMKGNESLQKADMEQAKINIDRAELKLKEALERDPGLRKAARNLIKIYLSTQRFEQALKNAETLVEIHPLYSEGWNVLTEANLALKDTVLAERSALRSLAIEPSQIKPLKHLAYIAFTTGDLDRAKTIWNDVLKQNPKDPHALKGLDLLKGK